MNFKNIFITTTLLSLAACASFGDFNKGLNSLIGQPIAVAINKLGYPTTQQNIAGDTVYRWNRTATGITSSPSYTIGTVNVGNVGYSTSAQNISLDETTYSCALTLGTDSKGVIKNYSYDGNLGGCGPYITALNKK